MKHHEHDCDHCTYLGSDESMDYYYHHDDNVHLATLIARYGEYGDYSSGTDFIMSSYGVNEALKRAYERGILPEAYVKHCKQKQEQWFEYYNNNPKYAASVDERWVTEGKTRFVIP